MCFCGRYIRAIRWRHLLAPRAASAPAALVERRLCPQDVPLGWSQAAPAAEGVASIPRSRNECSQSLLPRRGQARGVGLALEEVGDISWPEHVTIFTVPVRIAGGVRRCRRATGRITAREPIEPTMNTASCSTGPAPTAATAAAGKWEAGQTSANARKAISTSDLALGSSVTTPSPAVAATFLQRALTALIEAGIPFVLVNNNFSLARMVDPVWAGCFHSSDPRSRAWLKEHNMPILVFNYEKDGAIEQAIAGHPIHPMLIPFPIAFLSGAFGFDLVGRLLDRHARRSAPRSPARRSPARSLRSRGLDNAVSTRLVIPSMPPSAPRSTEA